MTTAAERTTSNVQVSNVWLTRTVIMAANVNCFGLLSNQVCVCQNKVPGSNAGLHVYAYKHEPEGAASRDSPMKLVGRRYRNSSRVVLSGPLLGRRHSHRKLTSQVQGSPCA